MLNKPKQATIEPLTITSTPIKPFDVVIIDTIGPLQRSDCGNNYDVTIICDLTKFLIAIAVPNKESSTIARAIFENLILKSGCPKNIRTDLGTEYKGVMNELCELMQIKHDFSTAYHHETLGTIERSHRTYNEYLRAFLNEKQWDVLLQQFVFCYNTSPHGAFNNKFTPFELVFARKCNFPYDLLTKIQPLYNFDNYVKVMKQTLQVAYDKARKLIDRMKENNKRYFDKKLNPLELKINDKVLVRKGPYKKHEGMYAGPFVVVKYS